MRIGSDLRADHTRMPPSTSDLATITPEKGPTKFV
jgi:hypothetical protein